jgi:hypothetical protein
MEEPPISTGEKSIKVKPDKSKKGGRRRKSSLPRKLSQVKIESRKLAGKELKEQTPITLSSSSSESVEHNRRDQEYEPPTAIIDMEPAEVEVELSKRTSDINDAKDDVTTKNNELAESKSKRSKQKALVKSIGAKRTHVSKVKNSPKIKVIPSSRTAAHKEKSLIELDQTTSDSSSNESIRLLHSTQRRKTQKYDDEAIRTSKHKKEKMDKTKKRKWRDWRDELKRDGKKRPKIHKGKTFDIEEADKRARKMKRKIKDESRKHPKEDELSHKKGYKTKTHHLEKGESSRKRKTHLNHRYEHKEKLSIDLEKEQVREVATEEKLPIDLGKDQGRELVTEEKLPTDLENKHEKEVVKEHVPQSIIDLNVPFYDFMDVNIENVGQKDDNENFETPMPHEEMRRSPSAALESIIMSSSSPEHHPLGLTLSLSHTPPPRPTPPSINQPEQFIKSRKHVKSREDKKVKTIRNKKQFASVSSDEEMKFSASKLKKHNHRRVHHKEKYSSPPLADSSSGTKNESEQNERKRRRREKKMKNISRISRRESERSGHEKLKDVDRTDRLRTEKSDQRKKTKYSDRSSRQKVEKSVQKNKHSSDQKKKSTRRDIIPHRPKPAAISEGDESSESMNGVVQAYASKKLKKAKEEEKLPSVKKTAKNVDSAKSVDAEVRAKKGAKDKKEKGHHVDHKKTKALDKRIDKSSKSVGHIDVPSDFSTSVDTIDTFSSSEKESSQEVKKETKKKATSKTKVNVSSYFGRFRC